MDFPVVPVVKTLINEDRTTKIRDDHNKYRGPISTTRAPTVLQLRNGWRKTKQSSELETKKKKMAPREGGCIGD